jgi:hypothetical protein
MLPQIVEMAEAGSGVDLISRALGIGAEVVRDALHLHHTGKRPPARVDGRRRQPRQPGKPFVPKYQQIAPEVDRRRKAGEGFERPVGEWNFQEVTVTGSRIRVELNGTVILDTDLSAVTEFLADKPHPGKDRPRGFFGFAGHGDAVEFRNVMLKQSDARTQDAQP